MLVILFYLVVILLSCFVLSFIGVYIKYQPWYRISSFKSFHELYSYYEMKILTWTLASFCSILLLGMNIEFFDGLN